MPMMAPRFLVEVRDRNFSRIGQIAPEYLDLKFIEVFRGVGSWELKLPAEHPLLPDLKTKGSGIIITETWEGGSRTYSGRTRSNILSQNAEDPVGTWVISGADDNILASATVIFPEPTQPSTAQTVAYWKLTGPGETVMKQAVLLNAGASALAERKYPWLSVPTNLGRGSAVSASARFDILGDVLSTLGAQSGLGWNFYQVNNSVVFDVTVPRDLTALIRLDIRNGGLESTELGFSAPSASRAYVLGQGEGADRQVISVTTTEATAETVLWGLQWETTKDQRNTADITELTKAGTELVTASGTTIQSLKVTPSDAPGQRLNIDWGLGDKVTVVVDGQETQAIVNQIAISVNSAGVIKQATVGDPVGFDWDAKIGSTVAEHDKRIDQLENYVDTSGTPAGITHLWAGSSATIPTGWLICDGRLVARATYARLFTIIGTSYGAGDGSTTFNLPNFKGRVAVGIDAAQSEFDTLGEMGGAKTHTLSVAETPQTPIQMRGTTGSLSNAIIVSDSAAGTVVNRYTVAAGSGAFSTLVTTGGGGAHNNLQPYMAMHYIIKT